jgi:hypothetical protein
MRADLAIDKLEAAPGIGDLLAQVGGKLGKQVAVFACGSFGVVMQLSDLAGKQRVPFCIERSDITFSVLYLARDAEKLSSSAFARNGRVDLAMIVKQTLQRFGIAAAVGPIGASHQQREVLLLGIVAREVRVYALGDIAKERLEAGRRIELFGFASLAERGIMGLLRALAGLLGTAARRVRVVQVDLALSNTSFQVIELGIQDANLAKITAFKSLKLSADLRKLRLALSERRANGGKSLALVEQRSVVRGLLEDDFGWHAASLKGVVPV